MIMLQLLETHCLSLLTYAIEIVHVANTDERRQLRVAYNSVFRRIFGYRWSQSVTALQHFLSRPTWEELVDKRKKSFTRNIRQCHTVSLSRALLHWYNDVSEGIYIGTIQLECLSLNYLFFNLTHLCTLVNCCSCHCTALHLWITNQSIISPSWLENCGLVFGQNYSHTRKIQKDRWFFLDAPLHPSVGQSAGPSVRSSYYRR